MRQFALVLLALPILLPSAAQAQATLNKCIDARGKVTYSNLPCRNAQEARKVEIDPAPQPDPVRPLPVQTPAPPVPAKPASTKAPAIPVETAPLRLETQRTSGKPVVPTSARQCDTLTEKLGRVIDKMDVARRKGYTQAQMNAWNEEARELERKKQRHGCF